MGPNTGPDFERKKHHTAYPCFTLQYLLILLYCKSGLYKLWRCHTALLYTHITIHRAENVNKQRVKLFSDFHTLDLAPKIRLQQRCLFFGYLLLSLAKMYMFWWVSTSSLTNVDWSLILVFFFIAIPSKISNNKPFRKIINNRKMHRFIHTLTHLFTQLPCFMLLLICLSACSPVWLIACFRTMLWGSFSWICRWLQQQSDLPWVIFLVLIQDIIFLQSRL